MKYKDVKLPSDNILLLEILKPKPLFQSIKKIYDEGSNLSSSILSSTLLEIWRRQTSYKGLEKYFNTPDDLFNENAYFWSVHLRNEKLFANIELPFKILMRYFDFLTQYSKPISCSNLIKEDFRKEKLNDDQKIFILDKMLSMIYQSNNHNLFKVYIELIDQRNNILPYLEDPDIINNMWDLNTLKAEADQLNTVSEKRRFYRLKQLQYQKEAAEVGLDLGIGEEIDIELLYLDEVDKNINTLNTILFLSASPNGLTPIRVDIEESEIRSKIKGSKFRNTLILETRTAITTDIISESILEIEPNIVHFSTHGENDNILIEGKNGTHEQLSASNLNRLLKKSDNIECIVLNACYSEKVAKIISTKGYYVIGVSNVISDDNAIAFSKGFYIAIGSGKDISSAFDVGRASLKQAPPYSITLWQNGKNITPS
ncbi:CHAT domain-containing protein [Saprospira grandis]|nr:CHAT domain-containing protein [Saprospira grandis]